MSYLKQNHNSWLVFDPTYPKIDEIVFNDCDWKDFYGDAEEAIQPNAPKPHGKDVDLHAKIDIYHSGDKKTRRSHTDYLMFCNTSLVYFLSKKQPNIETSVFGS